MTDRSDSQQRAFMLHLFGDDVARALGEIARLSQEERRSAIADPSRFLERAGLEPPEGVSFAILERGGDLLDDLGRPPDVPEPKGGSNPLDPNDPDILDRLGEQDTPPLVLEPICFRFCFSAPFEPLFRPLRRCVYICF
jgi:hypothetical protein